MTGTLSKRCDRRTDGRTDGQTERSILRAAWSQLKKDRKPNQTTIVQLVHYLVLTKYLEKKNLRMRLIKFLQINKNLFKYQYGFRKLYSTTLALIEFTDKIIQYIDEGIFCISVFVDPTKAFDTVDHEILLQKLEHYGIRGHANHFLRTYLANRQQCMVIKDANSSPGKIECGVP